MEISLEINFYIFYKYIFQGLLTKGNWNLSFFWWFITLLLFITLYCLVHGGSISCSVTSNSFQYHSSVHGILRGKNAGVCGHSLLQGIFPTQGLNPVSCIADGFFTIWATTEALVYGRSRLRIWQIHLPGQQALLDSKRRSGRSPNSTFCSFKPAPLPVQCFFILVPTSLLAKISSTPWEKQVSSLFPKHYLYLPQAPYTLEKHIFFPLCFFTSSLVLRSSLDSTFQCSSHLALSTGTPSPQKPPAGEYALLIRTLSHVLFLHHSAWRSVLYPQIACKW